MRDMILQIVARALLPFIILYGLYVIIFGHVSPGGGFSGGATLGAGLILYRLTFKGQELQSENITGKSRLKQFSNILEHEGMKVQAFTGVYTFFIGVIFMLIIFPVPFSIHANWFNVANGFKVALSIIKLFYLLVTEEGDPIGLTTESSS